jgi:hypothetical protein
VDRTHLDGGKAPHLDGRGGAEGAYVEQRDRIALRRLVVELELGFVAVDETAVAEDLLVIVLGPE